MPLPTTLKLFIDAKAGLAYPTYTSSSPVSNPSFYLGDLARLKIYLIEQTGLGTYPRQEVPGLGSPGIKVAIGEIDASPTAGHFHLTFGGDTTSNQAFNVTASALAADLNALASIIAAGGVTVSKVGDNYAIKFVSNGSRGAFTGDAAALIPLSTVGISVLQEGDGTKPEIVLVHLQQNVAALATSFTASASSSITSTLLSAWDGTRASYRIAISPDPKAGTFTLGFDADTGTDVSTSSLAVGCTALEVQNALGINALENKVTVQQVGAYAYDITVTAEPSAGGLTADGAGLISFAGFEGDLDINTANALSYLDGAESIETTLEVEISDGAAHQTVLQIPCTLRSSVVDETTINAVTLDPVLTEASADGRYLRQANDLSDLDSAATARTNLDVYSKAETDAAVVAAGIFLPLAGGTMTGAIVFDATGLQNINKGTFDNSTGGYNGISLTCAVGYELNWQGGRLVNWYSGAAQQLLLDSSLKITDAGGLTFSDATVQTTAATTYDGGTVSTSVTVSSGGSSTTVANTGITFPDSSVQTTAAVAVANVADCLAHTIHNVTWTGTGWIMTFQPINENVRNLMANNNLKIYSASGTDNVTGLSISATATFTTTSALISDYIYLRMVIGGVNITSTQPIN